VYDAVLVDFAVLLRQHQNSRIALTDDGWTLEAIAEREIASGIDGALESLAATVEKDLAETARRRLLRPRANRREARLVHLAKPLAANVDDLHIAATIGMAVDAFVKFMEMSGDRVRAPPADYSRIRNRRCDVVELSNVPEIN
jgi:hypothetical protein